MRRTLALTIIFFVISACKANTQPLPLNAPVKDLLTACSSNDPDVRKNECDFLFNASFLTYVDAAGGPDNGDYTLCLPAASTKEEIPNALKSYESKMLEWFRDHPEVWSHSLLSGTREATIAIYKCKIGEPPR